MNLFVLANRPWLVWNWPKSAKSKHLNTKCFQSIFFEINSLTWQVTEKENGYPKKEMSPGVFFFFISMCSSYWYLSSTPEILPTFFSKVISILNNLCCKGIAFQNKTGRQMTSKFKYLIWMYSSEETGQSGKNRIRRPGTCFSTWPLLEKDVHRVLQRFLRNLIRE